MTKHVITVKGMPVNVYINKSNTQAVIFPAFGRYYRLSSDNALDFATTFLVARKNNVVSFAAHLESNEETAVIQVEKIAA